jgi:molybdenum cofactor cytidylyltransferase
MIARVADAILATRARPVVVVTGHDDAAVRAALAGREVTFVHNPRHAEGMSTSLRAGLGQLGEDIDGALVCLGDMPRVRPAHLEALLGAFDPGDGRAICVPTWERRRGNPVLFASRYFPEMRQIEGDVGARALVDKHAAAVCYVPMEDRGVTLDVDTPEALEALRASS